MGLCLVFTGQNRTFVTHKGIHGKGCPTKSVLDFIFQWFCLVFVPSEICFMEQDFAKRLISTSCKEQER